MTTSTAPLLEVENWSIAFVNGNEERLVNRSLSFKLHSGECLGIIGESGSGKSMMCQSILGLLPRSAKCTGGFIRFDGQVIQDAVNGYRFLHVPRRTGVIFQDPFSSLNPVQRIGAQLIEKGLMVYGRKAREIRKDIDYLMEKVMFTDPERVLRSFPHELSGGMLQRVMIVMALIGKPKLVIADEPVTALDAVIQIEVLELLKQLRGELGFACILISHELRFARHYMDSVLILKDGQPCEMGPTAQLFNHPTHPYTHKLVEYMRLSPLRHSEPSEAAPVYAEFRNISVEFKIKRHAFDLHPACLKANDQLSLKLVKGKTLAVVGESGSGKSTLARAIVGLTETKTGSVQMDHHENSLVLKQTKYMLRNRIQMLFQNPYTSLNPRLTIRENFMEAYSRSLDQAQDFLARTGELLNELMLEPEMLNRYPHAFSGGQRQRLALCRTLLYRPEVIILDEPTSSLDMVTRHQILTMLKETQKKHALSYLLITHDFAVVREIADEVMVLKNGRVIETGSVESVWKSPSDQYTRLLLKSGLEDY